MKETPAIVRHVAQERVAKLRVLASNIRVNERNALERAIEAGRLIAEHKEECLKAGRPYLADLEKAGIDRRRAEEYLRLHEAAIAGAPAIEDCESIQSALQRIAEHRRPAAPAGEDAPVPTPAQTRAKIQSAQKRAAERAAEDSGETDDFGTAIPKRCLDAWKDTAVREARETLAILDDTLRRARLIDVVGKRASAYPFIDAKEFAAGIGQAMNDLEKCLDHLRDNLPAGVCPSCAGKGCSHCLQSGLVPRAVYEGLKNGKHAG